MIMKIDHIGVVVENLEESLDKWNDIFNLKVRRAFIHPEYLNGVLIELKEKRNEE